MPSSVELAVILAGGAGTRFWPLSRRDRPKQLLSLFGDKPMIEETWRRAARIVGDDAVRIVCGESLVDATLAELDTGTLEAFIIEAAARNTAPAIGLAAVHALVTRGDGVLAILPSDHLIRDEEAFARALDAAGQAAEAGYIATLGITPDRPETGYGYIRFDPQTELEGGARVVAEFKEKPDLPTATAYLESGEYVWNSGMFVFRPSVLLAELERQLPQMHAILTSIGERIRTGADDAMRGFEKCQKISIDHGVMEGAERVAVVPASIGWSDVGHWGALRELLADTADANVARGEVVLHASTRTLVLSQTDRVVAVAGVDGLVVVDTEDAVLVLPATHAQDVRAIVDELKARGAEART
jgi:mannose-1-phosphate guanylyltransferase/mannose-6-phosphate isomerase